jgi:hypothetical protein
MLALLFLLMFVFVGVIIIAVAIIACTERCNVGLVGREVSGAMCWCWLNKNSFLYFCSTRCLLSEE